MTSPKKSKASPSNSGAAKAPHPARNAQNAKPQSATPQPPKLQDPKPLNPSPAQPPGQIPAAPPTNTLSHLLDLAAVDEALSGIRQEAQSLENQTQLAQERLTLAQNQLDTLEAKAAANQHAAQEKKLTRDLALETIEKFDAFLKHVEGHDARQAAQKDLELAQKAYTQMDKALHDLAHELAALAPALAAAREEHQAAEQDLAQAHDVVAGQLASVRQTLATLEFQRIKHVEGIPPRTLAAYQRLVDHGRPHPLVAMQHGACGGCHIALTPQLGQTLRARPDEPVPCPNCGRLMHGQVTTGQAP